MALTETYQTRLATIRAALQTIDDTIDDLAGMPTPDTAADANALGMLTHYQNETQEFLDDVEIHLGVQVPHVEDTQHDGTL